VLSLYVFQHEVSKLLLLRRFMMHIIVFRCQNCNMYCIINITKIQNRRKNVFNIGVFTFVQGAWHSEISQKLHWFMVLHSSIWGGLELCLEGLTPHKPPVATGLQRSLSKEIRYTPKFFIDNVSAKLPCRAFAVLRKSWEIIMNPEWMFIRRRLTIIANCLIN